MRPGTWKGRLCLALATLSLYAAPHAPAFERKVPATALEAREFFLPELYISSRNLALDEVLADLPNREAWETFTRERAAAGTDVQAFIDPRSGAATSIIGAFPLIPGTGVGNPLTLADLGARLGRTVEVLDRRAVAEAAWRFLGEHQALLGVDTAQLGPIRAEPVSDHLWQVSLQQQVNGVRVRHARLVATVNHGNVVLFGTQTWGPVTVRTRPHIDAEKALEIGFAYADGRSAADVVTQEPRLEIVPVSPQELLDGDLFVGPVGSGYRHRLVWVFAFQRPPEHAAWEVLVDAHDGEVIAFQDTNHYAVKAVTGGVYPITATGSCPGPTTCGTMQSNWPMPWANTGFAFPNNYTNSAGVYDYTSGTATTTLSGLYVRMSDSCGSISAGSATGTIALGGTNNQHDCTTPGTGGAGNTPASRSGFYELNKLAEMARGWLANNNWIRNQLTSNMNIASTCNAFWNGSTVNFYRSGGGCRNTGELASVFDHEWGHGIDNYDSGGFMSNSSEGYADIAANLRLQTSCVGPGFFSGSGGSCGSASDGSGPNRNESQTGTHCDTNCSGVRDADYARHSPATADTPLNFNCVHCDAGPGPCGKQVHCSAAPTRQAAWDFAVRDLTAAPFSFDSQTAFLTANKVFYQGSGLVGDWHACTCGSSSNGCGATNGYMQWLAADDDNGNVNDGTPHMTALYAAFNRHGIACTTPTAVNSGCAGAPTIAPTLAGTAQASQASLSWNAAAGATRYWVMRTEGHAGCNFGKAKIAEVTGTSFIDTPLLSGRNYYYNVVAQGGSSACFSKASNCVTVTPLTGNPPPDFTLSANPSGLSVPQGGGGGTGVVTVQSLNGFASAVSLTCSGLPAGATCSLNPTAVTPPAGGSTSSTLTVTVTSSVATGSYPFQVTGTSGTLSRSTSVTLEVVPVTSNDYFAAYDSFLKTPRCAAIGRSCDSGAALLNGRDGIFGGNEPNQPNTLFNSCPDGTWGTYHYDESNDRLKVKTLDGSPLAAGKAVRIEATVWGAWAADTAHFWYTNDANNPAWYYLGTRWPTVGGPEVLSIDYLLPAGALQAVRVNYDYNGSVLPCSDGAYDDTDDLAFAATSASGGGFAVYDSVLKAPKCANAGAWCDTGSLVLGRDNMLGGAEPNQPNTLKGTCADGTTGSFHWDGSLDRIKVSSLDGTNLARGKTAKIEVEGWASGQVLDLYYSTNPSATTPTWTYITTLTPPYYRNQVLSATYTLPSVLGLQAVRGNFRYLGSPSPCSGGTYDDRDDLVFYVQ